MTAATTHAARTPVPVADLNVLMSPALLLESVSAMITRGLTGMVSYPLWQ